MCMVMLLSVSCGQQHDAEHIVKEFMKENMKDAAAMSSLDFDRMDSTRLINDSIITSIRAHAGESGIYKTEISYGNGKSGKGKKLFILRARYRVDDVDWCDTYYLDADLKRVVAFKTN